MKSWEKKSSRCSTRHVRVAAVGWFRGKNSDTGAEFSLRMLMNDIEVCGKSKKQVEESPTVEVLEALDMSGMKLRGWRKMSISKN